MNFSKQSVIKRQNKLTSKTQRYHRRFFIEIFKIILALVVLVILVCAGAGFGMMKGILDNSPDISSISIKPKGFKTVIYDQNGNERNTLSTINSNRVYVYYDDIPDQVKNAFISIEDERFWKHNGIDMRGIFRAVVKDVVARDFSEGASTITQQLIKNHVFNVGMDETTKLQSIERKVQEQYLAIDLEKAYTKEQILESYLNTIYLGQGVNGIEAAANRYFDKSVKDLTISEISVIAGITKNPYQYDPVVFPKDNDERRKTVLYKMHELGYITDKEYEQAKNDNVYERIKKVEEKNEENFEYNSFYTDALMNALCEDFVKLYDMSEAEAFDEIYTGGYSVYSVQDYGMQEIVDTVVNDPDYYPESESVALEYKLTLLDRDGETTYNYDTNTLLNYYRNLNEDYTYNNIYNSEEDARIAANNYKEAMINEDHATFVSEELKTTVQPQASFTVIEQSTGYIKAMSGGRGEKRENLGFNRATDALRQPGSTFKVLAAFLPYIDTEGGLGSCFMDQEYNYENGDPVRNWYGGYRGPSSLRDAIRDSMNIIAVQTITAVDPHVAYEYLQKQGFTTIVDKEIGADGDVYSDIQQATALGGLTHGVTNLEITAAYAGIANMGTYIKPVYYSKVYDHDGKVVIDNTNPKSRSHEMCKPTTAYQLIDAMKDVISSGTGTYAQMTTGIQCAGKTGTTSNSYDLWFCGMTPYLTSSVWFGYDSQIEESTNSHKTMWRDINDQIAEKYGHSTEADWEEPSGLTKATVCKMTGLLPVDGCPTCTDYFEEGHVPEKRCKGHLTKLTICKESHMRATNSCPDTEDYMVSYDANGNKVLVGASFEYTQDIFNSTCPLHPEVVDGVMITTWADTGGSITASQLVSKGTNFTVYIAPAAGYRIKDVTFDDVSIGAQASYTFTVDGEHHIYAYFEPTGESTTDSQTSDTTDQTSNTTEQTTEQQTTTEAPSIDEIVPGDMEDTTE